MVQYSEWPSTFWASPQALDFVSLRALASCFGLMALGQTLSKPHMRRQKLLPHKVQKDCRTAHGAGKGRASQEAADGGAARK